MNRFEGMQAHDQQQNTVLQAKIDHFNAGKKNQGGAAYNLLNLNYDQTPNGQKLE